MKENQNVEWKESWRDEYLKWICGFANAQGGKLYIGCDDNGNVVGVEDSSKLLVDVPNKIRNFMSVVADVNLLMQGDKEYIEIYVPPYPVAISYKGVYYYRSGSTLQTLSGQELESFILRKRGASWDNMPLPGFSIADIEDSLIDKFRKMAIRKGRLDTDILVESKHDLMERLRLTNAGCYTNAAMLLFSKNPDKWLVGAYTKIGFFENDANLIYQDEVHGSIFEQADVILNLIRLKYMKAKITYEGVQRIERYFVPEAALREAVMNALCHKQYESCNPIQISVYEDKLYISNCCSLPTDWTVEHLMSKHASRPYNTAIANVLYLSGLIENWGRGIEKICLACREDKSPPPEYVVSSGDIMIKFTAAEGRAIKAFAQKEVGNFADRVSEKELPILRLLYEDPGYSMLQLAGKAGLSRKTIAARLKSLREKGVIERIGSDRWGYWQIKGD